MKVLDEPCAGQPGDDLQGACLLEEMRGARHDLEILFATQTPEGFARPGGYESTTR